MGSASSTIPSPPRPSPFSLLPTELVQLIIELTVPYEVPFTLCYSQQWTLRSLCLVSKLFRQIAQPLLFDVLSFRDRNKFFKWSATGRTEKSKSRTRHLILYDRSDSAILDLFDTSRLASNHASIRTLTLCHGRAELSCLALIPRESRIS